jgi:hypothetical protein
MQGIHLIGWENSNLQDGGSTWAIKCPVEMTFYHQLIKAHIVPVACQEHVMT